MGLAQNLEKFSETRRNGRVETLLARLKGSEDERVLLDALRNTDITHASLGRAIRAEYGHTVATDADIRHWRSLNVVS